MVNVTVPAPRTPHDVGSMRLPPIPVGVRLLAASLVVQPLLLGINAAFHPDVEIDARSILAGAAEGPTRWYLVHVIAALGAACGVPVAVALRRLVGERGRTLRDVAFAAAMAASLLLSLSFVAEASVFRLVLEADVTDVHAVGVAEEYTSSPEFVAIGVGFLFAIAASVLFAAALLRARAVPRWMPVTMLLGTLTTAVAVPGTLVAPVGFAAVAVAGAGLAGQLVRRCPVR